MDENLVVFAFFVTYILIVGITGYFSYSMTKDKPKENAKIKNIAPVSSMWKVSTTTPLAMSATVSQLRYQLRKSIANMEDAERQFREYAKHHYAKTPSDTQKAEVNENFAAMLRFRVKTCKEVLTALGLDDDLTTTVPKETI